MVYDHGGSLVILLIWNMVFGHIQSYFNRMFSGFFPCQRAPTFVSIPSINRETVICLLYSKGRHGLLFLPPFPIRSSGAYFSQGETMGASNSLSTAYRAVKGGRTLAGVSPYPTLTDGVPKPSVLLAGLQHLGPYPTLTG
eukprot:TRINITY_DN10978_c0_g1_i2.p1 TRINITY_DN10978_c0_g1~~TRINITY_DN10978_c0_g1_i2.p1  ORF type:complete len:140 (+),score=7.97 TRINITY_DN10978_c0_g1_i2:539-958(+)